MSEIKTEYELLYKELEVWYRHHSHYSVSTHHQCPAYPKMVALGAPVVPLILWSMQREYFWWMIDALQEITEVNPVKENHRGRYKDIVNDWTAWGKANGYLPAG